MRQAVITVIVTQPGVTPPVTMVTTGSDNLQTAVSYSCYSQYSSVSMASSCSWWKWPYGCPHAQWEFPLYGLYASYLPGPSYWAPGCEVWSPDGRGITHCDQKMGSEKTWVKDLGNRVIDRSAQFLNKMIIYLIKIMHIKFVWWTVINNELVYPMTLVSTTI